MMRILTSGLIVTAGLVLAVELLSSVSQLSPPDIPVATEAPSAGVADGRDGTGALITCVLPPTAAANEATVEDQPCIPSADLAFPMETQMTEC